MKRLWDRLDQALSRCKEDKQYRATFCSSPWLYLAQFVYNHSTWFALLSGVIAAMLFDGWLWIASILLALLLFMGLPLMVTWIFKGDTI